MQAAEHLYREIKELKTALNKAIRDSNEQALQLGQKAAAERIRAEVLSMHASDDLAKVVVVMFQEMVNLGVETPGCSFQFIDEKVDQIRQYLALENPRKDGISWTSSSAAELVELNENIAVGFWEGTVSESLTIAAKVGDEDFIKRWREGKAWSFTFGGQTAERVATSICEAYGFDRLPAFFSGDWVITNVPFLYGIVGFRERKYCEDHVAIVQELTEALSLGYARFLDFQRLEAQNRNLTVDLILERVRAEVAAMQESKDLFKVGDAVGEMLKELGIPCEDVSIKTIHEDAGVYRLYGSGVSQEVIEFSLYGSIDHVREYYENWKKGETFSRSMNLENVRSAFQQWVDAGHFKSKEEQEKLQVQIETAFEHIDSIWTVDVPFAHGALAMSKPGPEPFAEEDIRLLERFAEVVTLGYARFLDFQRLDYANQQLQEANRLKADFLARMSHDLRTPMNAIIGYINLLLRKTKDSLDKRQFHNLEKVKISSDNMLNLIDYIMDLSKTAVDHLEVKLEDVDLKDLVDECAAAIAPQVEPGVQLKQQVEEVGSIRTDRERLRWVLMELLDNAAKFTVQGCITLLLRSVKDRIEISVTDTGPGILAENLKFIFDEFHQMKHIKEPARRGLGLSMAYAKKSIELLGGIVYVKSEVGKGTTFTVRISDYESAL